MPSGSVKPELTFIACLLLFFAVGLGAFGAHALRNILETFGHRHAWETAVHYQLVHGMALFAAGLFARSRPDALRSKLFMAGTVLMIAGTLLFSGSLYVISLGGPGWLGPVTPIGGIFLLTSWIFLGIWSLNAPSRP